MSKGLASSSSYNQDECQLLLLESKRDVMFARMQRIFDTAVQVDQDNTKLPSLLSQASNLDTLRKEFEQVLDLYNQAQSKFDPKYVVNYQSWTSFEELFCYVKQVLFVNAKNTDLDKPHSVSNFPKLKSHLPPIELISFDGDLTKWPLFYQQFKSMVHDNPNLSKSEKVFYLVGRLKEKASSVCAGLPAIAENYSIIWEALIQKYDDPRSLACAYLNQLLQFKPLANTDANSLDSFIYTFNSSVEALKQLKIDLTDFIFCHLATLKLDAETIKLFEINYRKEKIPSYEMLIEFVKEQSKVLSRGKIKTFDFQNNNKSRSKNIPTVRSITKSFVNTEDGSSSNKCVLCNNAKHDHLYKCSAFMKLTPKERYEVIKKNAYCTNCLSTIHKSMGCRSIRVCDRCASKHHSLLCFANSTKSNCSVAVNVPSTHNANCCSSISQYDKSIIASECSNIQVANNNEYLSTSSSVAPHAKTNISNANNNSNAIDNLNANNNNSNANNNPAITTASVCNISRDNLFHSAKTTLLGTAKIKVLNKYGQTLFLRCLVDPGSQSDYITSACCKRLSLNIYNQTRFSEIQGIGGVSQKILGVSEFKFKSRFDDAKEYFIQPLVVETITSHLPDARVNVSALHSLIKNIPLADDSFSEPGTIDLLIGVKLYCEILLFNKLTCSDESACAIETALGYVIMGDAPIISGLPHTSAFCTFTREPLNDLLEKFWSVEEVPERKFLSPAERECEDIYVSTTTRKQDGSFAVDLPFKESPENLGNSFIAAKKRYLILENKFSKSPELRIKYNEVIQDYLDKGILSRVPPEQCTSLGFYLPHRPIIRNDKKTTRCRIVLDGSMKTDTNISLNDILHTGCNLQTEIFNILLNVRLFKIAFFADVRQMYLCIEVHRPHRKFQRILYRFSSSDQIETFEFNRVTFGLRSSPFLALRTLRELAKREREKWPLAAAVTERDVYMDDLASSALSTCEAVEIAEQLIAMFKSGGFDLIKWTSNSPELLSHIPQTHRQSEGISLDKENTFKILGLHWFPAQDNLTFFVSQPSLNWTKRSILSVTAQLYDVLGLVGPVILYAKLIIKELWILKILWDEPLPYHIVETWKRYISELPLLSNFKVPRHLGVEKGSKVSLLAFADASEKAYGCVIYTHVTNGIDKPIVSLVCSKSRVASPSSLVTLARLELNALVLLAKLARNVYDSLSSRHPIDNIYIFSDSTVALCWLKSSPHRFQTYVANRISQFQTLFSTECLYHIPGVENPADCISRGLLPSQILNHELWLKGPSWTSLPINQWPIQKYTPATSSALPEQKTLIHVTQNIEENPLLVLSNKFSSWLKYLRSVVYIMRFIRKLPKNNIISAEDLDVAETKIIQALQNTHFADDINKLKQGISCSRAIQKLNPFILNNIIHVGGRLSYSSLDFLHKHPILLPKKGHIIDLIIDHYHRENLHAGPQILLSVTRQKFWILSARRIIKLRIHKCLKCYRLNPKPTFPIMANLPLCRLEQANAFTHTGVDHLAQSFWKRFKNDYLHTLQSREKWNTPSSPLSIGTVVLLNVENAPPLQWPLGVITKVLPGRDGVVRVAQVRTKSGTYERPVVKLCPLPTQ